MLIAGMVAFLLSAVITAGCKPLARRAGLVARPHDERWRRDPVALLGGVAIYVAVAVTTLVFVPTAGSPVGLLLLGGSVIFALGLLDDLRPLGPRSKLAVETLVAVGLVTLGLRLDLTSSAGINFAITVFWIVGLVNALNLLDNMDGLAAGIAIIAGSFRMALFLMDGNADEAVTAAVFVGATAGFLLHNWYPASIFMGDAGSLFLGFYLASLNLIGDWPYSRGTASVLVVPVLILLVPIFDTTLVTVTRRLGRRSIVAGGRDHVSHRLVLAGLSERRTVGLLYALAVAAGFLALLSYEYGLTRTGVLIAFALIALAILGVRLAGVVPERDPSDGDPEPDRVNERA